MQLFNHACRAGWDVYGPGMRLEYFGVLLWLAWLFRGCEGLRRNVTLVGVQFDWSAGSALPSGWNATVVAESAPLGSVGECPAGRYCPAGVSRPVVCPAGTFSTQKRLSAPCVSKCALNRYCPDPAVVLPCPNFTTSERGAASQAKCVCVPGYQCNYKTHVNLNIGLGVPYRVWLSPTGAVLKQAILQAVAESAGVSVGNVRFDKVLPGISRGGGRRLLEASESAVLSLSVVGADRVNDEALRGKLRGRPELQRKDVRLYWKRTENLRVFKQ